MMPDPDAFLRSLDELDRTLAHEAGHVVGALRYRRLPERVVLAPDLDRCALARVHFTPTIADLVRSGQAAFGDAALDDGIRALCLRAAHEDAVIDLSGRAAELALGLSDEATAVAGGRDDLALARDRLGYFYGDDAEDRFRAAEADAAGYFARAEVRALTRAIARYLRDRLDEGDVEIGGLKHILLDISARYAA